MPKYYPINEDAARRAKQANSFSDYAEGPATYSYQRMVDRAAEIADRQKARVSEEYHEKIDGLLDSYARKLADNLNRRNEIDARVPSVMIAGPANFPVRKKEKQNAARDRNEEEYLEIQKILDRISSVGMGGIMSDDKDALKKLTAKLEGLEALQEKMKAINAYFRKHKTLEGCPDLTEEARHKLESGQVYHEAPYPGWALSNNNANIRRIRERIAQLQKEAERAAQGVGATPEQGDGYVLKENHEIGRIQFIFDGKPDADTRALLKSNGFRWAPSEGAWQRMLNDNGRWAAQQVRKVLDAEA